MYQVVDAKFKSNSSGYYRAYIVNCDNKPEKYDVYFPEDSTPRTGTPAKDIREVKFSSITGFWAKDLDSFREQQFHRDTEPKGDFKVLDMKLDSYQFHCEPLSGRNRTLQYFDIGEVILSIKQAEEKKREDWLKQDVVCTKFYLGT